MQEICTSGSEGGGTETNRSSLPLFVVRPWRDEGRNLRHCCNLLLDATPRMALGPGHPLDHWAVFAHAGGLIPCFHPTRQ